MKCIEYKSVTHMNGTVIFTLEDGSEIEAYYAGKYNPHDIFKFTELNGLNGKKYRVSPSGLLLEISGD